MKIKFKAKQRLNVGDKVRLKHQGVERMFVITGAHSRGRYHAKSCDYTISSSQTETPPTEVGPTGIPVSPPKTTLLETS